MYKKENSILVEVEVGMFLAPWFFCVPFQSFFPLSPHDLPDNASSSLPHLDYRVRSINLIVQRTHQSPV